MVPYHCFSLFSHRRKTAFMCYKSKLSILYLIYKSLSPKWAAGLHFSRSLCTCPPVSWHARSGSFPQPRNIGKKCYRCTLHCHGQNRLSLLLCGALVFMANKRGVGATLPIPSHPHTWTSWLCTESSEQVSGPRLAAVMHAY